MGLRVRVVRDVICWMMATELEKPFYFAFIPNAVKYRREALQDVSEVLLMFHFNLYTPPVDPSLLLPWIF